MLNINQAPHDNDFIVEFLKAYYSGDDKPEKQTMLKEMHALTTMPGWNHLLGFLQHKSDKVVAEMIDNNRVALEVQLQTEHLRVMRDLNVFLRTMRMGFDNYLNKLRADQAKGSQPKNMEA